MHNMTDYLRVLLFMVFCVYSESTISLMSVAGFLKPYSGHQPAPSWGWWHWPLIQADPTPPVSLETNTWPDVPKRNGKPTLKGMHRDFNYPTVEEFDIYWNVPTFLCHKHGVHFEKYTRKFGITANPGDFFRGNLINILYDPGLFPAMMKNSRGRLLERNGGIPQLGNLTMHLESFKNVIEELVPEDFNGVGVIDFEAWRPIFRQNWNDQVIYKVMSKELERQYHPQWTEKKIELYAGHDFEEASKAFMENTLKLAKLLRPNGTWGYYAFPYCYNYRESKEPHCSEAVEQENNRIQWLFDESTAIYPSIYMSYKLTKEEHRKFVIGRLNEAWRVASRVSNTKVPLVFPYIWYKYYDSTDFLSEDDIYTALETTRKYKMGGAIIWGATENVSSKQKCLSLLDYLNTVLGPAVSRVKENNKHKLEESETLLGTEDGQEEEAGQEEDEEKEEEKGEFFQDYPLEF